MQIPSLHDLDVHEKRVLIRFDGDVPVENGQIMDDFRLKAVIPTIKYCRDNGASVVLLAHRGRPKGMGDPELSNEVVAKYFTEALGEPVELIKELLHPTIKLPIALLENIRYHRNEEANEPAFSRLIARLGDIYCNDAFAVSHRTHASVVGVAQLLPHAAGFNLIEEIRQLEPLRTQADNPYVVVLGGAKASDKTPIIWDVIDRADMIIIGGLVAIPFLVAVGQAVGQHPVDEGQVKLARDCIRKMQENNVSFVLPTDYVNQNHEVRAITQFQSSDLMIDIGPNSQELFSLMLKKANTIFWNGAMGKFEEPGFDGGTLAVARGVSESQADTRIGSGGDTVNAIHKFNLEKGFTFISTGGGATLEFIAGRELPGLAALEAPQPSV